MGAGAVAENAQTQWLSFQRIGRETLIGFASGLASAAAQGGRINAVQIAANAFGQALGNDFVKETVRVAQQQVKDLQRAAEKAYAPPAVANGPLPQFTVTPFKPDYSFDAAGAKLPNRQMLESGIETEVAAPEGTKATPRSIDNALEGAAFKATPVLRARVTLSREYWVLVTLKRLVTLCVPTT